MASLVSVVGVVEACGSPTPDSDRFLGLLVNGLSLARREVTVLVNAERAAHGRRTPTAPFLSSLKQMNVGFHSSGATGEWLALPGEAGTKKFRQLEHPGFMDVSALGGHIPTALFMPTWGPQAMEVVADWGTRTLLVPHGPVPGLSMPYFLAGRLHLSNLGPFWIDASYQSLLDEEGQNGLLGQIERRIENLTESGGGVLVLRLSAEQIEAALEGNVESASRGFVRVLDAIAEREVHVGSVRQMIDRWADISYDLALATDYFREKAKEIGKGTIGPVAHELGQISPAEQLAALSRIWLDSIRKGKPVRNTTLRSPLGPRSAEISTQGLAVVKSDELVSVLEQIVSAVDGPNRLPASVTTSAGSVALHDWLVSLASAFAEADLASPCDVPILPGTLHLDRVSKKWWDETAASIGISAELTSPIFAEAQQFVWTFKPATPN